MLPSCFTRTDLDRSVTQTIATAASCMHLWDMRFKQQTAPKKLQQHACSFLTGLVGVRTGSCCNPTLNTIPSTLIYLLASEGRRRPNSSPPTTYSEQLPIYSFNRLSIFSDLNAVKARMHVQHVLGLKLKRFQTISPQNAIQNTNKIPRTGQGRRY